MEKVLPVGQTTRGLFLQDHPHQLRLGEQVQDCVISRDERICQKKLAAAAAHGVTSASNSEAVVLHRKASRNWYVQMTQVVSCSCVL